MKKVFKGILLGLLSVMAVSLAFLAAEISSSPNKSLPEHVERLLSNPFDSIERSFDDNTLQVSFELTKPEYMVGEPVECVCLTANKSEKEQFYSMTGGGPPNSIEMEVIESPKGTKLRRAYTSISGTMSRELLKPGEVLRHPFLLNPFVWFIKPGVYKLRIKFPVYHADNREMKNAAYHYADQTLSLRCSPIDGAKSHAMMTALVKQAIAGEGDWRYAVQKLSVIGMPQTAGYIRACLRATDPLVRHRMLFECAGDLLGGLADIGGAGAKQALEEVIEDAKLHEDNWRWKREYAESVLHYMLSRPDLKRPDP